MLKKSSSQRNLCIKIIVLLGLFSSCFHGDRMNEVNYSYLFHDGLSKIWVISARDSMVEHKRYNYSLKNRVLIFNKSGEVCLTQFDKLYNYELSKGVYEVDSKNKTLTLTFEDYTLNFNFNSKNNHSIELFPIEQKDSKSTLMLESVKIP